MTGSVRVIATLLIAATVVSGCSPEVVSGPPSPGPQRTAVETRDLDISKVGATARRAAQAGDFRLYAVNGYSVTTPGVQIPIQVAEREYGLRIIADTKDGARSREDIERNIIAREYAERYNTIIKSQKDRLR